MIAEKRAVFRLRGVQPELHLTTKTDGGSGAMVPCGTLALLYRGALS